MNIDPEDIIELIRSIKAIEEHDCSNCMVFKDCDHEQAIEYRRKRQGEQINDPDWIKLQEQWKSFTGRELIMHTPECINRIELEGGCQLCPHRCDCKKLELCYTAVEGLNRVFKQAVRLSPPKDKLTRIWNGLVHLARYKCTDMMELDDFDQLNGLNDGSFQMPMKKGRVDAAQSREEEPCGMNMEDFTFYEFMAPVLEGKYGAI